MRINSDLSINQGKVTIDELITVKDHQLAKFGKILSILGSFLRLIGYAVKLDGTKGSCYVSRKNFHALSETAKNTLKTSYGHAYRHLQQVCKSSKISGEQLDAAHINFLIGAVRADIIAKEDFNLKFPPNRDKASDVHTNIATAAALEGARKMEDRTTSEILKDLGFKDHRKPVQSETDVIPGLDAKNSRSPEAIRRAGSRLNVALQLRGKPPLPITPQELQGIEQEAAKQREFEKLAGGTDEERNAATLKKLQEKDPSLDAVPKTMEEVEALLAKRENKPVPQTPATIGKIKRFFGFGNKS